MALKISKDLRDIIWPIGSVLFMTTTTDPNTLIGGSWAKLGSNRVLMSASSDSQLATTVESGLPQIWGNIRASWDGGATPNIINGPANGSFFSSRNLNEGTDYWQYVNTNETPSTRNHTISFEASRCNPIYSRSEIVQPPAIYCNMWRRTV